MQITLNWDHLYIALGRTLPTANVCRLTHTSFNRRLIYKPWTCWVQGFKSDYQELFFVDVCLPQPWFPLCGLWSHQALPVHGGPHSSGCAATCGSESQWEVLRKTWRWVSLAYFELISLFLSWSLWPVEHTYSKGLRWCLGLFLELGIEWARRKPPGLKMRKRCSPKAEGILESGTDWKQGKVQMPASKVPVPASTKSEENWWLDLWPNM